MNKKTIRYILDTLMMILMIVLMGYQVTGSLWHEILGVAILILFLTHCILNLKWFKKLPNIFKAASKNIAAMLWFLTNLLLLTDMIILAVSSVFISKKLFIGLGLPYSDLLKYLHTVSAYGGLIIMSVHLGCHWNIIHREIRRVLQIPETNKPFTIFSRIFAILISILGVISSCRMNIGSKFIYNTKTTPVHKSTKTNASVINTSSEHSFRGKRGSNDSSNSDETQTFSQSIENDESEDEYLSRLNCTGCGRHCPLNAPQCGTGSQQASQAREYYQEQSEQTTEDSGAQSDNEENDVKSHIIFESESPDDLSDLFLGYIPIAGLYVCGTYYSLKFIKR